MINEALVFTLVVFNLLTASSPLAPAMTAPPPSLSAVFEKANAENIFSKGGCLSDEEFTKLPLPKSVQRGFSLDGEAVFDIGQSLEVDTYNNHFQYNFSKYRDSDHERWIVIRTLSPEGKGGGGCVLAGGADVGKIADLRNPTAVLQTTVKPPSKNLALSRCIGTRAVLRKSFESRLTEFAGVKMTLPESLSKMGYLLGEETLKSELEIYLHDKKARTEGDDICNVFQNIEIEGCALFAQYRGTDLSGKLVGDFVFSFERCPKGAWRILASGEGGETFEWARGNKMEVNDTFFASLFGKR